MKLTCYLCVAILIISAISGGVFAFTGFNVLYFACLYSAVIYRSFLAVNAVAALFTVYRLIVFIPFKGLK